VESDKQALEYVAGLATGQNQLQVHANEPEHFAVVPKGAELVSLAQFQFAEPPVRKTGDVKVRDVKSFGFYFTRFFDEHSMIFANPKEFKFVGMLDYHEAGSIGEARRKRHKVTLQLETTERWKTWNGKDKTPMPQEDFATFIEDNLADIYAPDDEPTLPPAAVMLEVSRSLEASTNYNFKQATNLKNGQRQIQYSETINGSAAPNGDMTIPDEFMLRIPIFLNQPVVHVRCRLRFRISGGKLSMWFQMIRVDELLAEEFEKAREAVFEATSVEVVLGEA